jgi:hypothetical protein
MNSPADPEGNTWVGFDFDGRLMAVSIETGNDDGFDHEQFVRRGNPTAYRCTMENAQDLMRLHGWVSGADETNEQASALRLAGMKEGSSR